MVLCEKCRRQLKISRQLIVLEDDGPAIGLEIAYCKRCHLVDGYDLDGYSNKGEK